MGKTRVYELAQKLGLDNKVLLDKLHEANSKIAESVPGSSGGVARKRPQPRWLKQLQPLPRMRPKRISP